MTDEKSNILLVQIIIHYGDYGERRGARGGGGAGGGAFRRGGGGTGVIIDAEGFKFSSR